MGNNFFCLIENGVIYQVDTYNKVPIGYTNEAYNELQQTTDEYYNKLVELGVIVPPKSQEQINAELQQALKDSQAVNLQMLEIIQQLKQEGANTNESRNSATAKGDVPTGKSGRSRPASKPADSGEVAQ